MNEETPPPFDTVGDAPVEARIVAWVLGEASAFEAAELERLCEEKPELLVFRRRMRALHGLLTAAEAAERDHSWKLPEEKRKVLDEIFGEEKVSRLEPHLIRPEEHKEKGIRRSGRLALLAIAACLILTIIVAKLIGPIGRISPMKSAVATGTAVPHHAPSEQALQELAKAVREQEDKVEERRKVLATIVRTKGIIYKGQDSFYGQSGGDEDQGARSALQTYNQLEKDKTQLQTQLQPLNETNADSQTKAKVQAQLAMTNDRLKKVEVMKDDSREEAIKRGLDAQDYADAKRDFESEQQFLQALKLKQIEQTIASKRQDKGLALNTAPVAAQPTTDARYRLESKSSQSNREIGMKKAKEQSMLAKHPAKPASEVAAAQPQLPVPAESPVMPQLPAIAANDMSGGLGGSHADGARFAGVAIADESTAPRAAAEPEGQMMSSAPTLSGSKTKGAKLQSTAKPRVVPERRADTDDYYRSEEDHNRAQQLSQVDSKWELSVPADGELALADKYWDTSSLEEPRDKDRSGNVEYELHTGDRSEYLFRGVDLNSPDEPAPALVDLMEEIPAAETPYSTFSLNISDASFQLAKAALAKGERPDPAGIKSEQFYNAVDYGDPAPASNEPVAATIEQSAHPVIPGRNLVRVALRTGSVGRSAVQPLRLTLLVDQSGSMVREDRRASMEHALAQLGVLLTKADLVTVIGFSRTPHLLADGMTGDQATKLADLVNQTASEGGTNLEEAIKLGGQLAQRHQLAGAQNRIVLFTDGAANLGDANPSRLAEQVKSFRQQGLAFDIAGIGADGLNDRLLSELARNGNGRYYVVGDEKNDSFARQLAGAFRPAAENVKVQVNFNPQRVGKYKLIGFEKDRLKTEDFRNDAVDAAELAAEEAGVAIYQVEPLADGSGEIGEVSVRFRDSASKEMVERSWTIPYDAQATAFGRATPSMQLAGLSLLAAEKLRGGALADAIDFKQLTGPTSLVKQFYAGSPYVADMLRVIDELK
jgi:secreted protein with Ig-like and vWFA domain